MQTDPIGYGDGMNMYNYVGGAPINATDPSGLQKFDCSGPGGCLTVTSNPQTIFDWSITMLDFYDDLFYSDDASGSGGDGGNGDGVCATGPTNLLPADAATAAALPVRNAVNPISIKTDTVYAALYIQPAMEKRAPLEAFPVRHAKLANGVPQIRLTLEDRYLLVQRRSRYFIPTERILPERRRLTDLVWVTLTLQIIII